MFRNLIVQMARAKLLLDRRLDAAFEEWAARAEQRRLEVEQQLHEEGYFEITCPERERWK